MCLRYSTDLLQWVKTLLAIVLTGLSISSYPQELSLNTLSRTPTVPVVESALAIVKADTELDEEKKSRNIELLELAITRISATEEFAAKAESYANFLRTASAQMRELETRLEQPVNLTTAEELNDLALDELELRLTQAITELETVQSRIDEIDNDVTTEKGFDIAKAIEEVRNSSASEEALAKDPLVQNRTNELLTSVTRGLEQARIESLQQRQLSRTARLSLWETEKRVLLTEVDTLSSRIDLLRAAVTENRQSYAQRLATGARRLQSQLTDSPLPVKKLAEELVGHGDELVALIKAHDRALRQRDATNEERLLLERRFKSLTDQLVSSQLASSPEFGAALRKLRDQLVRVDKRTKTQRVVERALTEARLAQFRIDEQKALEIDQVKNQILDSVPTDIEDAERLRLEATIQDVLLKRREILDQLASSYPPYIQDLSQMMAINKGAVKDSEAFVKALDQHLLWMPSATPMNVSTFANFGSAIAWLVKPDKWSQTVSTALQRLRKSPIPGALGTLLVIGLFLARSRAKLAIDQAARGVKSLRNETFGHSIKAMVATLVLTLPVSIALVVVAGIVDRTDSFSGGLADALKATAVILFVISLVRNTVRENGLADVHFGWRENTIISLRQNIPWFIAVFPPLALLNILVDTQSTASIRDSLGRAAFVAGTVVVAVFFARVFSPATGVLSARKTITSVPANRTVTKVLYFCIVLLPLVIAGFSVAGYHYTAVKLDTYMIQSMLAILATVFLYCFSRRWFSIGEKKLALESDLAKQEQARIQSLDHETAEATQNTAVLNAGLQDVDLKIVRSQTSALLRTLVVVFLSLSFWKIWSDFAPAFKPLENVNLWGTEKIIDGVATPAFVTLFDVMLSVAIVIVTFLAAKNIPALIEIVLRGRRSLEFGTSYTITTVTRYMLVIIGTILSLQLLGAQWSKLQWLIAALSVGLGFGLQEIVANFVSGIVILFERPIRIGDTITVGDHSGTVTKIRIRATTILDWDRRELIIPNKTFITERLVNWTLTDPITRTTISVGVAYGSDVALVENTLLEIARRNSKVLSEPAPSALFRKFGESSLDFELRVFVRGIRDLIPVAHEIHVTIDSEFRKHGIEISFPQRDLHLDNKPIEIQIVNPSSDK